MEYYSQFEQDKFLNEHIFKNKRRGIFIDIGANDGVSFSNTYFFEKNLNWKGICFEPLADAFKKLEKSRTSVNINGCAAGANYDDIFLSIDGYGEMLSGLKSQYDGRHLQRISDTIAQHGGSVTETLIHCYNINKVLLENDITKADFISLDTEGGELNILKAIDFIAIKIKAIVVENNYADDEISFFLQNKGFKRVVFLATDEVYLHIKNYGLLSSLFVIGKIKLKRYLLKTLSVFNKRSRLHKPGAPLTRAS